MKYINNRLLEEEEEEGKIIRLNFEIHESNIDNIGLIICSLHLPNKLRIDFREELRHLIYLERDYGILSSIGIKFASPKSRYNDELEVFIKAPENSPYKNGVFNFIIKFNHDYPNYGPSSNLKTKIFHTEVDNEDIFFLNIWDKENVGLFLF